MVIGRRCGFEVVLKVCFSNDLRQCRDGYPSFAMSAVNPQNSIVQCFVKKWKGDQPANDAVVVEQND